MLIADIKRHSMSDTRAVVFLNSYATGTEKLQFTKMTTRSPAVISGMGHPSLSFALHDASHASVVSVLTFRALLKRFAAVSPVNPEINLLSLTIVAQEAFS